MIILFISINTLLRIRLIHSCNFCLVSKYYKHMYICVYVYLYVLMWYVLYVVCTISGMYSCGMYSCGMYYRWYVLYVVCTICGMYSCGMYFMWYVLYVVCILRDMYFMWYVLYVVCKLKQKNKQITWMTTQLQTHLGCFNQSFPQVECMDIDTSICYSLENSWQ